VLEQAAAFYQRNSIATLGMLGIALQSIGEVGASLIPDLSRIFVAASSPNPPEPPISKPGTIRFQKNDEQQARTLEAGVPHLAVHATVQALSPDHPGAHSRRDSEFP